MTSSGASPDGGWTIPAVARRRQRPARPPWNRPPTRGGGRRIGPGATVSVFVVTVAVLFGVSGGLLWLLGVNYDGVQGAAAAKIHPATYLTCIAVAMVAIGRANPLSFAAVLVDRHPATLLFILVTLAQIVVIVADGRPNLGSAVDGFLAPALLLVAATELGERALRRAEIVVHVAMGVNGIMGLAEFALGQRLFPYRFEGDLLIGETRSSALQGHPLVNATITGLYVMTLAVGGGPALTGALRSVTIVVQCAAMVAFGGRTASLVLLAFLAAKGLSRLLRAAQGKRVGVIGAISLAFLVPLAAVAVLLLWAGGFFDAFLGRLLDDGGSAGARLAMFDLVARIPTADLLVGPDQSYVDYARRVEGLAAGIENPIVRMLVYQGAILTAVVLAAFGLFLAELARRLRRGSWPVILYFLLVILSFESLASKSTLLSKFVIVTLTMLRSSPGGADTRRSAPPPVA